MPDFRLAALVAGNGAQPQLAVASAAPVGMPTPAPADLGMAPAVQAATQLAAPSQEQPAYPSQDVIGAWLSDTYNLGAPPSALGQTRASTPLLPPGEVTNDGNAEAKPVDLMHSGSVQTAEAAPVGGWIVQIGAGPSEASARAMLSDAASKVGALGDFRSYVERTERNGQTLFRARFIGFGNRDAANAMCNQLQNQDLACLAMQG